jgi:hypothetical protein
MVRPTITDITRHEVKSEEGDCLFAFVCTSATKILKITSPLLLKLNSFKQSLEVTFAKAF